MTNVKNVVDIGDLTVMKSDVDIADLIVMKVDADVCDFTTVKHVAGVDDLAAVKCDAHRGYMATVKSDAGVCDFSTVNHDAVVDDLATVKCDAGDGDMVTVKGDADVGHFAALKGNDDVNYLPVVKDNCGIGDSTVVEGDLNVNDLTVRGDADIGNLTVLEGSASVGDLAAVTYKTDVCDLAIIQGNAGVGGLTAVKDDAEVNYLTTLKGDADVSDLKNGKCDVDVGGLTAVKGDAEENDLSAVKNDDNVGDLTVVEDDTGVGDLTKMKDAADVNDLITMKDDADVGDLTKMKDAADVNDLTTMKDDADVGDLTTMTDDADVGDLTTMTDDADVVDLTTVKDKADVNDLTTMKDGANVGDLTTMKDDADVGDLTTVTGDVGVCNLLVVEGDVDIEDLTTMKDAAGVGDLTTMKGDADVNDFTTMKDDADVGDLTTVKSDVDVCDLTIVKGDTDIENLTTMKVDDDVDLTVKTDNDPGDCKLAHGKNLNALMLIHQLDEYGKQLTKCNESKFIIKQILLSLIEDIGEQKLEKNKSYVDKQNHCSSKTNQSPTNTEETESNAKENLKSMIIEEGNKMIVNLNKPSIKNEKGKELEKVETSHISKNNNEIKTSVKYSQNLDQDTAISTLEPKDEKRLKLIDTVSDETLPIVNSKAMDVDDCNISKIIRREKKETVQFSSPVAVYYEYTVISQASSQSTVSIISDTDSEETEISYRKLVIDEQMPENKQIETSEMSSEFGSNEEDESIIPVRSGNCVTEVRYRQPAPANMYMMTPGGDSYNASISLNFPLFEADTASRLAGETNTMKLQTDEKLENIQEKNNTKKAFSSELGIQDLNSPAECKSDIDLMHIPKIRKNLTTFEVKEVFRKVALPTYNSNEEIMNNSPDLFLEVNDVPKDNLNPSLEMVMNINSTDIMSMHNDLKRIKVSKNQDNVDASTYVRNELCDTKNSNSGLDSSSGTCDVSYGNNESAQNDKENLNAYECSQEDLFKKSEDKDSDSDSLKSDLHSDEDIFGSSDKQIYISNKHITRLNVNINNTEYISMQNSLCSPLIGTDRNLENGMNGVMNVTVDTATGCSSSDQCVELLSQSANDKSSGNLEGKGSCDELKNQARDCVNLSQEIDETASYGNANKVASISVNDLSIVGDEKVQPKQKGYDAAAIVIGTDSYYKRQKNSPCLNEVQRKKPRTENFSLQGEKKTFKRPLFKENVEEIILAKRPKLFNNEIQVPGNVTVGNNPKQLKCIAAEKLYSLEENDIWNMTFKCEEISNENIPETNMRGKVNQLSARSSDTEIIDNIELQTAVNCAIGLDMTKRMTGTCTSENEITSSSTEFITSDIVTEGEQDNDDEQIGRHDREAETNMPDCPDIISSPGFITATEFTSQNSSTGFDINQSTHDENMCGSENSSESIPYIKNQFELTENQISVEYMTKDVEDVTGNGLDCEVLNISERADGMTEMLHEEHIDIGKLDAFAGSVIDQMVPDNDKVFKKEQPVDINQGESLYGCNETKKKLYSCDVDMCDETDEPLCKPVYKTECLPSHEKCFKWKYAPSCDLDTDTVLPVLEDENEIVRITPIKTCSKPIRLGLSRRQPIHSLHKLGHMK